MSNTVIVATQQAERHPSKRLVAVDLRCFFCSRPLEQTPDGAACRVCDRGAFREALRESDRAAGLYWLERSGR